MYRWLDACGSISARKGAIEPSRLRVVVLGNPVSGEQVWVEVQGRTGQAVKFVVSDEQGHEVSTQAGELATGVDRFEVKLGPVGGHYYLRVSTDTAHQTVRVVRQ